MSTTAATIMGPALAMKAAGKHAYPKAVKILAANVLVFFAFALRDAQIIANASPPI